MRFAMTMMAIAVLTCTSTLSSVAQTSYKLVDLGIGGPGQDDVLGDAVDLLRGPGAAEEVVVDLGLPAAEAGAGPGA